MTQMLISVTNVHEARTAIENGADVVDLKDPEDGALGALPIDTIRAVVNFVNNTKLVSATIGNIPLSTQDNVDVALNRIRALIEAHVHIIKIGFFSQQDAATSQLLTFTQAMCLSKTVKFVAVLFAENHYDSDFIEQLLTSGFCGVMVDTMYKNGKTYLDYNHDDYLTQIANKMLGVKYWFGIAGSLQTQHIAAAKKLNPTYIGFRGAACIDANRKNSLSAARVQAIRKFM